MMVTMMLRMLMSMQKSDSSPQATNVLSVICFWFSERIYVQMYLYAKKNLIAGDWKKKIVGYHLRWSLMWWLNSLNWINTNRAFIVKVFRCFDGCFYFVGDALADDDDENCFWLIRCLMKKEKVFLAINSLYFLLINVFYKHIGIKILIMIIPKYIMIHLGCCKLQTKYIIIASTSSTGSIERIFNFFLKWKFPFSSLILVVWWLIKRRCWWNLIWHDINIFITMSFGK